ncbi:hypothetical protein IAT38_007604 [Cryptococcus sp. DSM 104549]
MAGLPSSSRGLVPLLRAASTSRRRALVRQHAVPLPSFLLPSLSLAPSRRWQSTSSPQNDADKAAADERRRRDSEKYNYNPRYNFDGEPDPDHVNWRRVTAKDLQTRKEPPKRVKMLVRDFVDDSLYNPHYGYFSKNATIFAPPKQGYDFSSFKTMDDFQDAVARQYHDEYGALPDSASLSRQVWHTPSSLFKPYYARSLISAIVQSYKLNHFPSEPLIIYEVGAGNGSFMVDALAYLRDFHPDVFERTSYRVLEISTALSELQRKRAEKEGLGKKVQVLNRDFFKWEGKDERPCFVVALEVFDNFAHDMVRYDIETLEPMQAIVTVDAVGDFTLLYEPVNDELISRVLDYRRLLPPSRATSPPLPRTLLYSSALRKFAAGLPFAPNLTSPDFIPTKSIMFAEKLREKLPGHRLLMADFSELPEAVKGRNGPVVQTRYGTVMVPCETFLVKQGYFDIFFPTDFELFKDIYSVIMNSPSRAEPLPIPTTNLPRSKKPQPQFFSSSEAYALAAEKRAAEDLGGVGVGVKGFRRRDIRIYKHAEFLEKYGGPDITEKTKVKDGENVMTEMYKNAKMMF